MREEGVRYTHGYKTTIQFKTQENGDDETKSKSNFITRFATTFKIDLGFTVSPRQSHIMYGIPVLYFALPFFRVEEQ